MQVTIEQGSNAEWATAIGTIALAVMTFLAVLAAVFQDRIRSWIWRPKLDLRILPQPPDCLKIPAAWPTPGTVSQADSYYLRAQVENTGHRAAEMVEVYLGEILEQTPSGDFVRQQTFLPLNLLWANFREPTMFLDHLSPHVPKHCDVAHIIDPAARTSIPGEDNPGLGLTSQQTALSLDLVVKPNTFSYLLPPGTYRLKLVLGAANARPVAKYVKIALTGQWFDDQEQMLRDGLRIGPPSDSEVEPIAP